MAKRKLAISTLVIALSAGFTCSSFVLTKSMYPVPEVIYENENLQKNHDSRSQLEKDADRVYDILSKIADEELGYGDMIVPMGLARLLRNEDPKPQVINEEEFLSRINNGEQAIITGVQDKCYADHFKTAKNAHICSGACGVMALGSYFMDYSVCNEGYSVCASHAMGDKINKNGTITNGALIRAIVNKDATIVSSDYLNDVRKTIWDKYPELSYNRAYYSPVGSKSHILGLLLGPYNAFAKILGYDIVKSENCFYIYNRKALSVCEKDLELTLDQAHEVWHNSDLQFAQPFIMDKNFKIPENFDYDELDSADTINVDPENPYYTYENGILYNKDKSVIIFVKAYQPIDLDSNIQKIEVHNFNTGNHELIISKDFHPINDSYLNCMNSIISLDPENPYYRYNLSTCKIEKI